MPRKPDTPCAGQCGELLWTSQTSLPAGERMCRPCRKRRSGVGQPCSVDGCERPVDKQRLCSMHLARRKRGQPLTATSRPATCSVCGDAWEAPMASGPIPTRCPACVNIRHAECRWCGRSPIARGAEHCSTQCSRWAVLQREGNDRSRVPWKVCPCGLHFIRRGPTIYCREDCYARRRKHERTWFEGPCLWCRERFTSNQPGARYCTSACQSSAGKYRRGRFLVPLGVRTAIYERDHWTCQLCMEVVDRTLGPSDPWGATLDHIIPRSWQLVPDDSPRNLRLAHRWCNSVRGDEQHFTADDLAPTG